MKSFFEKINPSFFDTQEINFKVKYKTFTQEELNSWVKHEYCWIREEITRQAYCLEVLINDKEWRVRLEVARKGYGLDKLVNDKSWVVRKEVAKHGYGLDVLVNDPSSWVRWEVEKQLKKKCKS